MNRARGWSVCLLLPALCVACNPQPPRTAVTPSPVRAARPTPLSLHITGQGTAAAPVRSSLRIHNRTEYELVAKSFESRGGQGNARVVFQDARVTFYDRGGRTMTATSPQAIVDQRSNLVTLLGGVHATTNTGMSLQSDRLVYDHAGQTLHGSGNVTIANPSGFRATGSSFDSDVSLSRVRMR